MVPVLFGILMPLVFVTNGMMQKHMTQPRIGFVGSDVVNTSIIIVNTIILIVAIIYWVKSGFVQKLFWIGFAGSIFDSIGKVCSLTALEYGPGGVSTVICSLSGPLLVVVVALVDQKMLKLTEFIALIFCMFGSFVLVVPSFIFKIIFCQCCKKEKL